MFNVAEPPNDFQEILAPLTGIVEDTEWESPFIVPLGVGNTMTTLPPLRMGITDPPSYMVRLLLSGVVGYRTGTGDKSSWEVRLVFKGKKYRLWDWKGYSWSIGPVNSDVPSEGDVGALIKKIEQAVKRLDAKLAPGLRQKVEEGHFYLANSYRHVRGGFDYFHGVVEETLKELDAWRHTPMPSMESDPGLKIRDLHT